MIEQYPIILILAPLFGAILVTLLGLWRSDVCLPVVFGALAVSVGSALVTAARVAYTGPVSYFLGGWATPLGVGIELRVDMLSALVLVVIGVVALLTAFYSHERVKEETGEKVSQFYTLYLLLVAGLLGMTITADAFNLYVLLEVSSLTSYGLIAMGKSKRATLASFNYIIMGTIGASFYLLGVGYLYLKTGTLNMGDINTVLHTQDLLGSQSVLVAFLLILVGVWIKMAFFPLFGWLPNAYSFAPSTTGCLLAPLMTKVSIYIMIRMMLTVFGPEYVFGELDWGGGVVKLAIVAIIAGSVMALAQNELKKMLCYLIVAEVGYMVGGAWLANHDGMAGAIYHIISDAFMTLCLFLAAGIFFRRTQSHSLSSLEGMFRKMPWTMACFTVGAFAMIGIPPTCGFFSKWYLIQGGMAAGQWGFVVALLISSLVNAVLFFRIIEIGYFGVLPEKEAAEAHLEGEGGGEKIAEAPASMLFPLVVTAATLILLGLYNADIVELIAKGLKPFAIVGGGTP